jgi:hypothetical protein
MNITKWLCISSLSLIISSCASSYVNTAKLPDTYQCQYMNDVCKEATEFETKYEQMTPEQKKEFKNLLMTYRSQCNDALDACKKSDTSK